MKKKIAKIFFCFLLAIHLSCIAILIMFYPYVLMFIRTIVDAFVSFLYTIVIVVFIRWHIEYMSDMKKGLVV